MKKFFIMFGLAVAAVACNQSSLTPGSGMDSGKISFVAGGPAVTATVTTKATAVTVSDLNTNGFNVNAVKGSAGSDVEVWSNQLFTKVGDTWEQDKWWPNDDQSYRFFATYPTSYAMTFAAGGPTISASNEHDIICAYKGDATYKSVNTLAFDHIFARLRTVTVSMVSPYTISNMSIMIAPKVSGTYNLYTGAGQTDGTGWSSTVEGSATNIATAAFAAGVSTTNNDIYLVPGTYTLSATWTATKDNYTQTFTNKTVDVALVAGKTNNITASLTGDGSEIKFNVSVTAWSDNAVSAVTFPLQNPITFAGLMIAPAPLYYDETEGFMIKDDDWDHWSEVYGLNDGSYCFTITQLGKYFDSDGESYTVSSGVIDNTNHISYGEFDDWRLITSNEWNTIQTNDSSVRPGSSVNGVSNCHFCRIQLSDNTHLGINTYGILLFPDDQEITGATLETGIDSFANSQYSVVTSSQLDAYLAQGCVFIPGLGVNGQGSHVAMGFNGGGVYWTANAGSGDSIGIKIDKLANGGGVFINSISNSYACPVRLVRSR